MHRYVRVLIGFVFGLGIGLAVTALIVVAKIGFLVNTPRAAHPLLVVLLVLVPAAVGAVIGVAWPTRSTKSANTPSEAARRDC